VNSSPERSASGSSKESTASSSTSSTAVAASLCRRVSSSSSDSSASDSVTRGCRNDGHFRGILPVQTGDLATPPSSACSRTGPPGKLLQFDAPWAKRLRSSGKDGERVTRRNLNNRNAIPAPSGVAVARRHRIAIHPARLAPNRVRRSMRNRAQPISAMDACWGRESAVRRSS
jgi:hypothetical protein